jgi:hypothetical protein
MQLDLSKFKHIQIILPFKLPTWNQLLAMNHWQRAKVTKWIRENVAYIYTRSESVSPTPMELVLRLRLTEFALQEYLAMIQPRSLTKSRHRKRLAKMRKL